MIFTEDSEADRGRLADALGREEDRLARQLGEAVAARLRRHMVSMHSGGHPLPGYLTGETLRDPKEPLDTERPRPPRPDMRRPPRR